MDFRSYIISKESDFCVYSTLPCDFRNIRRWLNPDGTLFIQVFSHKKYPQFFDNPGSSWMARHFFTGGMMPSVDLPLYFQQHLALDREWHWNGTHYQRTANTWLKNLDQKKSEIIPILAEVYGRDNSYRWFHRWRLFFMACAELFGMQNGTCWGVHQYRFHRAR